MCAFEGETDLKITLEMPARTQSGHRRAASSLLVRAGTVNFGDFRVLVPAGDQGAVMTGGNFTDSKTVEFIRDLFQPFGVVTVRRMFRNPLRQSDDVHIAYHGEGSFDLLFVPGFVSNIEATWQSPALSAASGEPGDVRGNHFADGAALHHITNANRLSA
jgi:hypothetical protein